MKSQERHELKTNELVDMLEAAPQWLKDNLRTIIYVAIVVVLVIAAYFYKSYEKNTLEVRKQVEFTSILSRIPNAKILILQAQAQGNDLSYALLQPQKDLETVAQTARNNDMAALALIKRADVIRMDLHYRPGPIEEQELAATVTKAKDSYNEALSKASTDPLLRGQAKLGLALCEEELGNFDNAKKLYSEIVDDKTLAGTPAASSARIRLIILPDYQTKIVLQPAPAPQEAAAPEAAAAPQVQLQAPQVQPAPQPETQKPEPAPQAPAPETNAAPVPAPGPNTPAK